MVKVIFKVVFIFFRRRVLYEDIGNWLNFYVIMFGYFFFYKIIVYGK